MTGGSSSDTSVTDLTSGAPAVSGEETEHRLTPVPVDIVEFEDTLFRNGSAVMMPRVPISSENDEGDESEEEGEQLYAGINSIALVLRQFEFSPERKILVTGHTDSQGAIDYNFSLSFQRARSILYLLKGDHEAWAQNCYLGQKVADCKQILTYIFQTRRWPCNPGSINNTWNNDAERATENFIRHYNSEFATPNHLEPLNSHIMTTLRRDDQHRWPGDLWEGIYEIYEYDLRQALGKTVEELQVMQSDLVEFITDTEEYVGCAYSFPRDDDHEEDYRSETDRRVEVIFYPDAQAPTHEQMTCPSETDALHTAEQCPVWSEHQLDRTYIDPGDLHAVPFHIRLKYFDRVKKELLDVPDGIRFSAIVENQIVPVRTIFNEGLYTAIVQFPTSDEAEAHANDVILSFTTTNKYVYTASDSEEPTIVTVSDEDFQAATLAEKLKHYDLPPAWNCRNWRCKVGDAVDDWEHHGQTRTSGDSPIEFNLDDLVLLTAVDGSQAIRDRNGDPTTDPKGTPIDLSKDDNASASPPQFPSRVKILHVDPQDNKMKLYSTNASGTKQQQHDGSLIRFQTNHANDAVKNFIKDPPGGARAVLFCGEFYDITNRRTKEADTGFNFVSGHVLGARAAVLDDNDVHRKQSVIYTEATPIIHGPRIGDYQIHYLHGGGFDGSHHYSYLVTYWSGFVMKDTNPTNGTTPKRIAPTDAQVNEFKSIGMFNAMEHWNKKGYEFVPHEEPSTTATPSVPTATPSSGSDSSTSGSSDSSSSSTPAPELTKVIRPFFMFEAFENFKLTPPTTAINFKTDSATLLTNGNFTDALTQARGGVPRSLVFVTEEGKGSWVRSGRVNGKFSIVSLRIKTRQDDTNRFAAANLPSGTGFPFGEFNDEGGSSSYGCLVIAHELGHATGQIDDYMERAKYFGTDPPSVPVPNYGQFGIRANNSRMRHNNSNMGNRTKSSEAFATRHDDKTMMDKNGPIRMRHLWRFTHWLNEKSQSGQDLNDLLSGQRYEIHYSNPSPAIPNYYRDGTAQPKDPWETVDSSTLTVATNRTMNVYLYKTLDELMRVRRSSGSDTDFKAILVVRPLLSVAFEDTTAGNWTKAQRDTWSYNFNKWFTHDKNVLDGKFMLSGGSSSNDLEPTLIKSLAGYDFYDDSGSPSHTNQNFKIVVKWNSDAVSQSGNTISVGGASNRMKELFYYLFNKPGTSTGFVVGDLDFIKNWYNGRTTPAGSFNVVEV